MELHWLKKYYKGDLDEAVKRRANGEPLQYILGEWEFYGYPVKVGPGVLIPRPETEFLVDLAKEYKPEFVLDLCAGTGCVGIALAKETGCKVIAVEKYDAAIGYLKQNIALNDVEDKVEILQADVLAPDFEKKLSIVNCQLSIVVNAPYLSESEMRNLQKEVTYEPREALYGGTDGLDFFRALCGKFSSARLTAFEVGDGQAEKVRELMANPRIIKDYNKISRIVYSVKE